MRIRVISPQLQIKTCWTIKETGGRGGSDENATEQFLSFLYPVGDFQWKRVVVSCSVVSDSLQPTDCSMPGFLVLHHLLELAQTHVIDLVMPSNHLILCRPLFLLPSAFLSIRVFSNELALCIRWPKYWSFSFSISPSNEQSRLISFRIDWFDLLVFFVFFSRLISLQSKGTARIPSKISSRISSNTTVQKHQFFSTQPSSWSNSHIHT